MNGIKYIIFSIILFFWVFIPTNIEAQNFQGIVHYEASFIVHNNNLSVEYLEKQMGRDIITYFKDGFYKEVTESDFMCYQLFRHDQNRIYFKNKLDRDTLRFSAVLKEEVNEFKYEVLENVDTILGNVCNVLIVEGMYGKVRYYYSSNFPIDPIFYSKYTLNNKNKIVEIMKSIYLRLEMEYPEFTVTVEAKEIVEKRLRKREFKVPKHKILSELLIN